MGFNFPLAPTVGTIYPTPAIAGAPQYVWDGVAWKTTVSSSGSPPYIAAPVDALAYNGIQVNGSMEVSQENGATSIAINNSFKYVVDGWTVGVVGASVATGQHNNPPLGFPPASGLIASTTAANASPIASDQGAISSAIEGYRINRLGWGTANAKPITISFWVASNRIGVFSGCVNNASASHSYIFTFAISVAHTWEYKTVTIPGPTVGVWQAGNLRGLAISFTLLAGSSYIGTAGAWVSGNFMATVDSVFIAKIVNDYLAINGVVVLPGTLAPTAQQSPLVMRPFGEELVLCQRYYRILTPEGAGLTGLTGSPVLAYFTVRHANLRATPTVSALDTLVLTNVNANFSQSSPNASMLSNNAERGIYSFANFTGLPATGTAVMFANSASSNRIAFDARL
jgi:hypothetical protein